MDAAVFNSLKGLIQTQDEVVWAGVVGFFGGVHVIHEFRKGNGPGAGGGRFEDKEAGVKAVVLSSSIHNVGWLSQQPGRYEGCLGIPGVPPLVGAPVADSLARAFNSQLDGPLLTSFRMNVRACIRTACSITGEGSLSAARGLALLDYVDRHLTFPTQNQWERHLTSVDVSRILSQIRGETPVNIQDLENYPIGLVPPNQRGVAVDLGAWVQEQSNALQQRLLGNQSGALRVAATLDQLPQIVPLPCSESILRGRAKLFDGGLYPELIR